MTYRDRDRVVRWLEAGHGEKLTTLDRGILRDLAEAANSETGHAWLGQDTLSARWGVTTRAVKLSITRLHRHGLLATAEPGRWHRRARYLLIGEVARGNEGSPYTGGTGGTRVPNRGNEGSQQGEPGFPHRGNEGSPVSRSDNGAISQSSGAARGSADAPPQSAADETTDGIGLGPAEQDITRRLSDWTAETTANVVAEIRERFNPRNLTAYVARLSTDDLNRIAQDIGGNGHGHLISCPRCSRPWPRGADVPGDMVCSDCKPANQPTNQSQVAVKKMASILGCELIYEDGEVEAQLDRAGVYLNAWTSESEPDLIGVATEFNENSPWPEDKPLPDEPFRDRARRVDGIGTRYYRPYDAVAIAEAWHEATREDIP